MTGCWIAWVGLVAWGCVMVAWVGQTIVARRYRRALGHARAEIWQARLDIAQMRWAVAVLRVKVEREKAQAP